MSIGTKFKYHDDNEEKNLVYSFITCSYIIAFIK